VARIVVFGNAGSGKSTYAAQLARLKGLSHLDLDTLVWEPGKVAVSRPTAAVEADLRHFLDRHTRWVIEGCYSEWVHLASRECTELVFLNPGEAVCLAHCRARPWEPHKYSSPEEQNRMLDFLLGWVRAYYTRDESCSLVRHEALFRAFAGPKRELNAAPELSPP
jgi:adenylate kinase family enzyme